MQASEAAGFGESLLGYTIIALIIGGIGFEYVERCSDVDFGDVADRGPFWGRVFLVAFEEAAGEEEERAQGGAAGGDPETETPRFYVGEADCAGQSYHGHSG